MTGIRGRRRDILIYGVWFHRNSEGFFLHRKASENEKWSLDNVIYGPNH